MIVRSGVDIENPFETIQASRFLGVCDEECFNLFKLRPDATVTQNPREGESNRPVDEPQLCNFSLWLPHGLDAEKEIFAQQLRDCKQRFNAIEAAFREVKGIPKDKLWLEKAQAEFFEQNQDLLPGINNDFPNIQVVCTDVHEE